MTAPRTLLVAVVGTSPAVLTEAVWALAREKPATLPDRVLALTTTTGARAIREQLLGSPAPWSQLRGALLGRSVSTDPRLTLDIQVLTAPDSVAGTTRELDDIRTPADNAAAAEQILAAVRTGTTDPECRVLGLLAGGRKTMGALLHAALSLAGRPGDRLLHVLVNEPFDHPRLTPPFLFPGQPGVKTHRLPGEKTIAASRARVELADVPLVALGELVLRHTGRSPATFASLARAASAAVDDAARVSLAWRMDGESGILIVDTQEVRLPRGRCSILARHLFAEALAGRHAPAQTKNLASTGGPFAAPEDVNKAVSELREALRRAGQPGLAARLCPPRQPPSFLRPGILVTSV